MVPTKYPSGGEKQLIKLLTDKEVPGGKNSRRYRPCLSERRHRGGYLSRSADSGEPLISRITTLTGQQFAQPEKCRSATRHPYQLAAIALRLYALPSQSA